jgi:hypothetical protein
MCFKTPEPPKLPSVVTPPSANDMAIREREQRERLAIMMSGQGTAGTVKTDLAPGAIAGQQQQQRKVLLGV